MFAPGTTAYTVSVPNSVDNVVVMPTATNTGATITVIGNPVTSGTDSTSLSLTAGTPLAIPIIVTAADGTTTMTYTVTVTRLTPLPTATLTGTLTEANLFAATTLTVVVDLENTEFISSAVLAAGNFTVSDTVDGTVSLISIDLINTEQVELTLGYDDVDITGDGTLSVTVLASGHTGDDDLITNTIDITASAGVNICSRTTQVQNAILAASAATECTSVTDLATIADLDLTA